MGINNRVVKKYTDPSLEIDRPVYRNTEHIPYIIGKEILNKTQEKVDKKKNFQEREEFLKVHQIERQRSKYNNRPYYFVKGCNQFLIQISKNNGDERCVCKKEKDGYIKRADPDFHTFSFGIPESQYCG